ncbi:unnamed protein product [Prunus armeniaca]
MALAVERTSEESRWPAPPAEDIERWKLHCLKLSDLPVEQDESSTESPEDRKACSGPARDGAAVSRSMDTSLQQGQPRSSLTANKSSSQEASSAGIKRLVSANSRKANGMQEVRGSSRQPYCPKLMICLVRRTLRSKVRGVCAGLGTKLRGLYLCPATMTRLRDHEQSSAELTRCCKLQARKLKSRLLEQRVLQSRELLVWGLVIALLGVSLCLIC